MVNIRSLFLRAALQILLMIGITSPSLSCESQEQVTSQGIKKICDGLYEAAIVRDGVKIFFYHQELKTGQDYNFWESYKATSRVTDEKNALRPIYNHILEQENDRCAYKFTDATYAMMRDKGISNPLEYIERISTHCKSKGMTTTALRKLLDSHATGIEGFSPIQYVVFASKIPLSAPFKLEKYSSTSTPNKNPEDLSTFSNILACYASLNCFSGKGGIEHRGIFRSVDSLLLPDEHYKNLSVMAHVFGAEVERTFLGYCFLTVRPLQHMLLMLAHEFPSQVLHGAASDYFNKNVALNPYQVVLTKSLVLLKEQAPLVLQGLKDVTGRICEQGTVVIDLNAMGDHFLPLFERNGLLK